MSVRFKFRSSVNFDSIEISGGSSISVRDLRYKIVEQKNLKICQDFDLVISDAVTGQEYEDENHLVPIGSSVIIKRVPAGRSTPSVLPHVDAVDNPQTDPISINNSSLLGNVDMENFDDFGIDFYPALGGSLVDSDPDDNMDFDTTGKADKEVPRSSETSIARCPNFETSDLSEAVQKGPNSQENTFETNFKSKNEEQNKAANVVDVCSPTVPKFDLPSELRCSLCNTIFKEAVMIPCCQHSFCEKCIHKLLLEKARCPKCLSAKCRVDDLLPNLSLRQAIEHFLESQMLLSGSDNILPTYAPDGESGIRAKEVSCAISVRQREPALPDSPSATGKGSNQVMTESVYESVMRNKVPAARTCHLDVAANSGIKKKGPGANVTDEVGSYAASRFHRKGDRTCYMCGSPDHFIRDCPAATGQYPLLQTGDAMYPGGMPTYGPPYWQGSSYAQVRPFGNVYATPGMMPYAPTMVPVAPFGVSPYMSTMYGGMSAPCGYMNAVGLVPPMAPIAERPVSQAEFLELQENEQRHRLENQNREQLFDGDPDEGYYYPHPSHESRPHFDRGNSGSYSENSDTKRSRKKHSHHKRIDEDPYPADRRHDKASRSATSGRDRRAHHHNLSGSGLQEMSGSSNQHSKERHKHHQRSSKKHSERRVESDVDSLRRNHYQNQKESGNVKRHSQRRHERSESGLKPDSSGDKKRQRKEKESSHTSKHSRHMVMSKDDEMSHERWEMIDGLNEGNVEDYYHHHKRKRRH